MKKLRLTFTFLVLISLSGGLAGKFNVFSIYLEEVILLYHKENYVVALESLSKWEASLIAKENNHLSGLIFLKRVKSTVILFTNQFTQKDC